MNLRKWKVLLMNLSLVFLFFWGIGGLYDSYWKDWIMPEIRFDIGKLDGFWFDEIGKIEKPKRTYMKKKASPKKTKPKNTKTK